MYIEGFGQRLRMTASEIAMGRYMRAPDHPPVDEFDAAFASMSATDDGAPPADPPADPPAADPPAADPPAADPPADGPPADPPPGDPELKAGDPPPAPTPKPEASADEAATLARLAALVNKAPEAPAAPTPAAAPTDEAPLYTAEEQTLLDAYEKEWGDVSKAEGLKRRAEYRSLLQYTFKEIMGEFAPIREMVEALAGRTHVADITSKIGEYTDQDRTDIEGWVNEQPTYLQTAYMSVINEGTAEEVADLVGRYRTAKGIGAGAPPAPGGGDELSGPAKQAAAALAPVGSKRSVVQQQDDPANFDAAWGRFADTP